MIGHRTCIICLPRTGSQLCERLQGEIHNSFFLGEYFENWNRSVFSLDADHNISLKSFEGIASPFLLFNEIEERLALLKKVNVNQSLSLRIFLMDHYDKDILRNLMLELKNLGFEFITLYRDVKEQLLSYIIARAYEHSKNKNVFGINNEINEPVFVKLTRMTQVLGEIYHSSINWESNVSLILNDIEYQKVNYASIYNDMEKIYNTKFKYLGEKSIKTDPFDLMINKKEVMNFLVTNYSGLWASSRFTNSADCDMIDIQKSI